MWRVWAALLFGDEEPQQQPQRQHRDPVLPASSSESAQAKKASKQTAEGFPSFQQRPPNLLQTKAYELINLSPVDRN
jgi:hypothetical protein